MSRALATWFKQAINSRMTSEVIQRLITVSHPTITPFRWTYDCQPVVSNGVTYDPYDVMANLIDQRPDEINNGLLTVSNINGLFLGTLGNIPDDDTPITCTLQVIGNSQPNSPQMSVQYFIERWTFNKTTVNCVLTLLFPYGEKTPGTDITADKFPGFYRA